jgi:hypothetical protein
VRETTKHHTRSISTRIFQPDYEQAKTVRLRESQKQKAQKQKKRL